MIHALTTFDSLRHSLLGEIQLVILRLARLTGGCRYPEGGSARIGVAFTILVSTAACTVFLGPSCSEAGCQLEVATGKRAYLSGESAEVSFTLWSDTPFRARLFDDPLCNLTFRVSGLDRSAISSSRICSEQGSERPVESPNLTAREEYQHKSRVAVSQARRHLLSPDDKLTRTVNATLSLTQEGEVFVQFADDVYFVAPIGATVRIRVIYISHDIYGDDDGAFLATLRVSVEEVDGAHLIRIDTA